jgi:hypothetical protein
VFVAYCCGILNYLFTCYDFLGGHCVDAFVLCLGRGVSFVV